MPLWQSKTYTRSVRSDSILDRRIQRGSIQYIHRCLPWRALAHGAGTLMAAIAICMSLTACGDMRSSTDCLVSGNQYFAAGDYVHAAMDYREALKREPDSTNAQHKTALNNLGVVLNALGKHDEAVQVLKSAIELDPKNHISHYALAQSLSVLKRYKEAVTEAQTAVELSSDELAAHRALGDAALGANELELATNEFRYLIKQDADDYEAHQKLGEALYRSGDKENGLVELKKAIELKPDNVEVRKAYANVLRESGDTAGALEQVEEALKHESGNEELKQLKESLSTQK